MFDFLPKPPWVSESEPPSPIGARARHLAMLQADLIASELESIIDDFYTFQKKFKTYVDIFEKLIELKDLVSLRKMLDKSPSIDDINRANKVLRDIKYSGFSK